MYFFKKRNTVNSDGLLFKLKTNYPEYNFEVDPTLLEQIIMIESHLAYFKKQYPEIIHYLTECENNFAEIFNTKNNKFNPTKPHLTHLISTIKSKVSNSRIDYTDCGIASALMFGGFLISGGAGLELLLTGITAAAAGGPAGLIIGGAMLLTLAVGFIALAIAGIVNFALAKDKINKCEALTQALNSMTDNTSIPDDVMENSLADENTSLTPTN